MISQAGIEKPGHRINDNDTAASYQFPPPLQSGLMGSQKLPFDGAQGERTGHTTWPSARAEPCDVAQESPGEAPALGFFYENSVAFTESANRRA